MPFLIEKSTSMMAAGDPPKVIEEFVGRINSSHQQVSIARMKSPPGWSEPGQRPEFEEISIVLTGVLVLQYEGGSMEVHAGQAVITSPGEWIQYSTPLGAEYVAVCLPAFSPQIVHRDSV